MKKMITNRSGLVTAVAVSVAALAPQMADAGEKGMSVQSSMERRLEQMEQEIQALRAELAKSRADTKAEARATAAKVDESQQKLEKQLAEAEEHEKTHHDLLFFRGGYTRMTHARDGELLVNNNLLNSLSGTTNVDKNNDGWYVGAGFDHRLSDDLWGMTDIAAVDGEVMFEYKNFGSNTNSFVDFAGTNVVAGAPGTGAVTIKNQVTMFTLTASPKIKFNQMGDFRPWIIPFGLGINVISPPSSGVTVMNPGLLIGTGAEFKIWKDLYAGLDFRYQFTGGDLNYKSEVNGVTVLNKTDTDHLTAGAYLGFGF